MLQFGHLGPFVEADGSQGIQDGALFVGPHLSSGVEGNWFSGKAHLHLPNLKANVELPACTVYPWNIGKSLWISVSSWSGRIVYHDTTGYSATCCYQENASCVQCIDLAEDIAKRPQLPHAEVANCHCSKDYLCALCGSHCCCLEKAWGGYTI